MATFFLSGAALLASSLVLSIVAGIRYCRRRLTAIAKDSKHKPLPPRMSGQSDCFIAFNKEVVSQAVTSQPQRKRPIRIIDTRDKRVEGCDWLRQAPMKCFIRSGFIQILLKASQMFSGINNTVTNFMLLFCSDGRETQNTNFLSGKSHFYCLFLFVLKL